LGTESIVAIGKRGGWRSRVKGAAGFCNELRTEGCLLPARSGSFFAVSAILFPVLFAADLSFSGPAAVAESPKQIQGKLPTLTKAREAHNLTTEEAGRGYPVHLQGVVTYYDPSIGSKRASLFVHDATGGIYAEIAEGSIGDISPGTLIDLRGVTGRGEFAPIVAHPQIKVLGRSGLPANPRRESLTRLASGAEDGQWVEAEGLIHSVVEYGHNVMLQLVMPDGTATVVLVKAPGATYSGLVDAKVRIRASAAPTFNASLQMIGVRLMCPDLSAVTIVEAPPDDPFRLPIIPIDKLLRWDQVNDSFHRVHLRGRVTLQWPGSSLCIRDATGGICVQTAQGARVAIGEDVDVVGFAIAEDNAPVLTDAVYRSATTSGPVVAVPVTAEQALNDKHDSELIQIEGQLIGSDLASSDTTLLIASGRNIFTAILPKNLTGPESSTWKNGSVLRVTGICSIRLDMQRSAIGEGMAVPKSFRVLMRSTEDVAVIQKPSWWTPAHVLALLALALIGTLVVLAWVMALRRRVEQQTNLLRESEERFRHMAQHDALTGLATRLVLDDRMNVALERAKRQRTGLALLMVDIDKFKDINDTFGHQAGDKVLRVTADRILGIVRRSDTVARMGGDEFVALLPDLHDPQAAERIAANLVAALSVPIPFEGRGLPVSVSVGVCATSAGELDADTLLKNSDIAMYQAKADGRNRFQVFAPELADTQME